MPQPEYWHLKDDRNFRKKTHLIGYEGVGSFQLLRFCSSFAPLFVSCVVVLPLLCSAPYCSVQAVCALCF